LVRVEVRLHRFGGTEYRVRGHEIGHVHESWQADLLFPRRVREGLVASGRASLHHLLPEAGWMTYYIEDRDDVGRIVALFRLNYDRLVVKAIADGDGAYWAMIRPMGVLAEDYEDQPEPATTLRLPVLCTARTCSPQFARSFILGSAMRLAGVAVEKSATWNASSRRLIPSTVQEITRPLHEMPGWRDYTHRATPSGHPVGALAPGSRWPLNVVGKRDSRRRSAWPRRPRRRTPATILRGT
jgi:hypothetical protein